MQKIIVLWLALLPPPALVSQTTDTLWSVPQLDGTICYRPGSGIYNMSTSSAGFFPGDGFDVILGEEVFCRDYLSFDLRQLSKPDTSAILNATIGIYQHDAIGNDLPNTYPIWNVPGGDTVFCILDHIDYGGSLDLGDWTAGDPGDPQTLQTNIGTISDDTTTGYKTMDITNYLKEDIALGRMYNQYRMRFPVNTDWDHLVDGLQFTSGNSILDDKPYLIVQYNITSIARTNSGNLNSFNLSQNYPNPFNPRTTISYTLDRSGMVELSVFDITGRKVQILVNARQFAGYYEVQFDGSFLSSGVYWYQLEFEDRIVTKKMVLIR
ncbi:MAG: T9SS type A sorting domain-containing protein [Aliifodinibius sp.]|nr:T9SS type A sorting domain-containing protein [Fodinibius sp.]NIV11802.1 T9SS type A sorting domain-containing protein [Fodinibius sp.]NIY25438.1 T9SS type A sorting domain-containing protein [Fodinibius sp.]